MPPDYEKIRKKAYLTNRKDAVRAMRAGELDKKIKNFSELHGFSIKRIRKEIKTNAIVATFFAKDPSKQRIHEKIAARFIESIPGVSDFALLPNAKLYVVRGEVLESDVRKKRDVYATAKTIDFRWRYGGALFYAAHKYTKGEGGGQGNQYRDLQEFLNESKASSLSDIFFIAIADGVFYLNQNGQAGISRMEKLKELSNKKTTHACAIGDLEELMKKLA